MHRHSPLLRKLLLLMLVPLILINGRVSAGCICMDGHFKLFCDGHGCCAGNANRQKSDHLACGDCCNQPRSSSVELVQSCCSQSRNNGVESDTDDQKTQCSSPNGCHKLSLVPMKLTEKDSVTVAIELAVLDKVRIVDRFLSVEVSSLLRQSLFLPPRERLKLLQRLLI